MLLPRIRQLAITAAQAMLAPRKSVGNPLVVLHTSALMDYARSKPFPLRGVKPVSLLQGAVLVTISLTTSSAKDTKHGTIPHTAIGVLLILMIPVLASLLAIKSCIEIDV